MSKTEALEALVNRIEELYLDLRFEGVGAFVDAAKNPA